VLVCVVIDKLDHYGRYGTPLHPYHCCLNEIIERYAGWLESHGQRGDIMAEARGKPEDRLLIAAFQQIHDTGELVADRERNQRVLTSRNIKFRDKEANVPGLQLADLLAHPLKQAVLAARGVITQSDQEFGPRLVRIVRSKLLRDETTGQVEGHGQVWLPK
jgi:hypothetical protein